MVEFCAPCGPVVAVEGEIRAEPLQRRGGTGLSLGNVGQPLATAGLGGGHVLGRAARGGKRHHQHCESAHRAIVAEGTGGFFRLRRSAPLVYRMKWRLVTDWNFAS